MNMVKYIAISLFWMYASSLKAQFSSEPDINIAVDIVFATVDKLHQIYVITPDNNIIKYDENGDILYRYTNNYLGAPSLIDASNPIQILVYYPGLQTIVTLDVTLNEISRTNLVSFGFFDIKRVCVSNDAQIWIMDGLDFKLKKIDRYGTVLRESEDLLLRLGRSISPIAMLERQNKVLVLDSQLGLLIFDNLGNYVRNEPFVRPETVMTFGGKLFYLENQSAFSWDIDTDARWTVQLPENLPEDIVSYTVLPNALYAFHPAGIMVYRQR
ncbi:MAG: hypothetical protein IPI60_11305 [Saprospiraceae bacterium]|nr:hypothetical protein [Saprospiraceae bacterium]